ncbi:hypothetical protein B0J12DRAFT_407487 [Macrophomina phaseolina]|uniref:SET domain-containing protein n=1 Tax=Macrophomina phaseolina TaxID=35725 RepID=A0ABQ8GJ01_9PEZI|nr:hypothetical protein B0J12DRAFT_407487 [Macrophomina phaseolina]
MLSSVQPALQARPASPHSDSSTLSNITVADPIQPTDTSVAASSTPPTSLSDDMSVHEDAQKPSEQHAARRHSSRPRSAVATYNDKENAGTRIHTPAKYRKDKDSPLQSPQQPEHTGNPDAPQQSEHNDPPELPQSPKPADGPTQRRQSGRARNTVVTYNDKENAGTRIHTPTKYIDGTYIRKTLHDPIPGMPQPSSPPANNANRQAKKRRASGLRTELLADSEAGDATEAEAESASPRKPARQAAKPGKGSQSLTSQLGKRGRDAFETVKSKTVGSTKTGARKPESPKKRQKKALSEWMHDPTPDPAGPRRTDLRFGGVYSKPWLNYGKFYNTGQDDLVGALTVILGHKPKTNADGTPANKTLPLPMFSMAEKLDLFPKKKLPEHKRPFEPFQLPYDVFCPLPKEAKVKDWRELKKNEYKGEDAQEIKARARDQCKKQRQMEASTCNCVGRCERDGCFNASLFFECDDRSCNLGPNCGNRQFNNLQKRYKDDTRQGKYFKSFNVGVEVMETPDRGHGVRAMRPFHQDQIVVEYIGEIITQQESDRRVNEVYKDHKAFYLMNFYDKLIIDGYRGNVARFVNHSCDPNCRMEKWTVNGEQRMALFANRNIMTGEELTWHYNFESYGKEQPCYCGAWNCAGVIGRRNRFKLPKEPAAGNKRKSPDDVEERPKKKQKVNRLVEAASNAANARATRASRQQQSASPKKAQTAATQLRAESSRRPSQRSASSKATETPERRPRSAPTRNSARSTRAISLHDDEEEDSESRASFRPGKISPGTVRKVSPGLARRVPKAKSPLSSTHKIASSRKTPVSKKSTASFMAQDAKETSRMQTANSKSTTPADRDIDTASTLSSELSTSITSTTAATTTPTGVATPVSNGKPSTLKQSRLSFLPGALGFQKGDFDVEKAAKKVVKKKSSKSPIEA